MRYMEQNPFIILRQFRALGMGDVKLIVWLHGDFLQAIPAKQSKVYCMEPEARLKGNAERIKYFFVYSIRAWFLTRK